MHAIPTRMHTPQVLSEVQSAVSTAVAKQSKKVTTVAAEAATAKDSRARTELEAAVKNEEHKLKKVQEVQQRLEALVAGGWVPPSAALWSSWYEVSRFLHPIQRRVVGVGVGLMQQPTHPTLQTGPSSRW